MSAENKTPYFDENFDRQLKPFPKKWMDLTRFKVGDRVEFLEDHSVCVEMDRFGRPTKWANLKGQIGIVEKVNPGYGAFPPRFIDPDGGDDPIWIGQHCGWLTVRFPFDGYGREPDGRFKPRACCVEDEGTRWRKVPEHLAGCYEEFNGSKVNPEIFWVCRKTCPIRKAAKS